MSDLRIAVLGVGLMGADHVARIQSKISGARVAVVNDYVTDKAEEIAAGIPGCRAITDPLDAIADPDVDAVVLATPGPTHGATRSISAANAWLGTAISTVPASRAVGSIAPESCSESGNASSGR